MDKKDKWFEQITAQVERPPTMKQIDYLVKLGYTGARPKTLKQASELIGSLKRRQDEDRDRDFDFADVDDWMYH